MSEHKIPPELPDRDKLMTRPDAKPLPVIPDPTVHGSPADPKPKPKGGQSADPKADKIDYVA
jgi:hypothetical protein